MLSPPVLVGMAIFCPLRRVPLTMIETICSEPFSATSNPWCVVDFLKDMEGETV